MKEIIFLVKDAPEGGFTARSLGDSIYTDADTVAAASLPTVKGNYVIAVGRA